MAMARSGAPGALLSRAEAIKGNASAAADFREQLEVGDGVGTDGPRAHADKQQAALAGASVDKRVTGSMLGVARSGSSRP